MKRIYEKAVELTGFDGISEDWTGLVQQTEQSLPMKIIFWKRLKVIFNR